MKYINTNKLDDTQYEFLSNLVIDLAIVDKAGVETEFEIGQLKEDEDGVIYAPTSIYECVDLSPSEFGKFELSHILNGYTPLATILKERKGTLA